MSRIRERKTRMKKVYKAVELQANDKANPRRDEWVHLMVLVLAAQFTIREVLQHPVGVLYITKSMGIISAALGDLWSMVWKIHYGWC